MRVRPLPATPMCLTGPAGALPSPKEAKPLSMGPAAEGADLAGEAEGPACMVPAAPSVWARFCIMLLSMLFMLAFCSLALTSSSSLSLSSASTPLMFSSSASRRSISSSASSSVSFSTGVSSLVVTSSLAMRISFWADRQCESASGTRSSNCRGMIMSKCTSANLRCLSDPGPSGSRFTYAMHCWYSSMAAPKSSFSAFKSPMRRCTSASADRCLSAPSWT
mmetsp:Transcript_18999/g.53189  ORF Transcript_18999/g.53189 Transcript_18999/m.53189 type:complete len:221 (-) Transcript_18999:73-735(-)